MWKETIPSILVLLIFTNESASDVFECTSKQCKTVTPRSVNGLQQFLNFMQNKNPPTVVHMHFLKPPPLNLNLNWGKHYLMPEGFSYKPWPTSQPVSDGNNPYPPPGFKPAPNYYDGQYSYQQNYNQQQVLVRRPTPTFYYVGRPEYGQDLYGSKNIASQNTQFPYKLEVPSSNGQRPSTDVEIIKAITYALPTEITAYNPSEIPKQYLINVVGQPQIKGVVFQNPSRDTLRNAKELITTQEENLTDQPTPEDTDSQYLLNEVGQPQLNGAVIENPSQNASNNTTELITTQVGNMTDQSTTEDTDSQYFRENTMAITFNNAVYDEEAANHTANSNRTSRTPIIDGSNFLLINNTVPDVASNNNSAQSINGTISQAGRAITFTLNSITSPERSRFIAYDDSVQIVRAITTKLSDNQEGYAVTEENDLFAEQSRMRKQKSEPEEEGQLEQNEQEELNKQDTSNTN